MRDIFRTLYKSSFRLVYAHDDHVIRVVFIFLNLWWVYTDALPVFFMDSANLEVYAQFSAIVSGISLVVGFFLMLFRENNALINANYLLTMLLLFNHVTIHMIRREFDHGFGAFVALAIVCTLSYLRYNVKQQASFSALMARAQIDVAQTERLVKQ